MELTEEQFLELRELRISRGRECTCHINPPCGTCTDPIAEDEAEELEIPFEK